MTLGDLVARVPGSVLAADPALVVSDVTHDSRKAAAGTLFVAIKGLAADGNAFADAARKKGAVAVASEEPPRDGIPWLRVPDAREALALLSAAVLGDPASHLELVGVTGTNGKTTTTHLIDAALRRAGKRVGLLGTVQYRIADQLTEAVRTTPEASDLQKLLAGDGGRGVHPRGPGGLVPFPRPEARPRLRVPGGRLHEPDPGPPRLPRRHGRATSRPSRFSSARSSAPTAGPS